MTEFKVESSAEFRFAMQFLARCQIEKKFYDNSTTEKSTPVVVQGCLVYARMAISVFLKIIICQSRGYESPEKTLQSIATSVNL